MEEILDTRLHKSLDKKWKWEVCVFPLIFSSFILSDNVFQRSKKDKSFHQSKPEHLWYLQRWHGYNSCRTCKWSWTWKALGPVFIFVVHYICYEHIIMFCMILNDLSGNTEFYHRKHKGLLHSMESDAQSQHSNGSRDTYAWNWC